MKKNILFLVLGISTSMLSKLLQFYTNSNIGDIIVLFSAIFFVCAIAFSIRQFNMLFEGRLTKKDAIKVLTYTCIDVLMFQIMMILVVNTYLIGLILIIPIIGLSYLSFIKWKTILSIN